MPHSWRAQDETLKEKYVTACADVARMYKDELAESVRLWERFADADAYLNDGEIVFETEKSTEQRALACEQTLELCPEHSLRPPKDREL